MRSSTSSSATGGEVGGGGAQWAGYSSQGIVAKQIISLSYMLRLLIQFCRHLTHIVVEVYDAISLIYLNHTALTPPKSNQLDNEVRNSLPTAQAHTHALIIFFSTSPTTSKRMVLSWRSMGATLD